MTESKLVSDYLGNSFRDKQAIISLADRKANIMLGLIGIILSIFFTIFISDPNDIGLIEIIVLAPFVISAIFAILAVIPRKPNKSKNPSLLFFGGTEKINPKTYAKNLIKVPVQEIIQDYITNIKTLSLIISKKLNYLRYCYIFLAIGFLIKIAFEIMQWI